MKGACRNGSFRPDADFEHAGSFRNYMPENWRKKYAGSFSEAFANKYLKLTKVIKTKAELEKLNENTETFITGSDQVFRYDIYENHGGNAYQLDFAAPGKRKIACAASFGYEEYTAPSLDTALFWSLLEEFDALSVRENAGAALCRKNGLEADVILDPVFYPDMQKWLDMAGANTEKIPEGGVLYFALPYKNGPEPPVLEAVAEKLGAEVSRIDVDGTLSVEAWLDAIRKARFVVTDSFHGTCFSIILHKPFLTVKSYAKVISRIEQILSMLGMEERMISPDTFPKNIDALLRPINWEKADAVLDREKEKGMNWLRHALEKPVIKKSCGASLASYLAEELRACKRDIRSNAEELRACKSDIRSNAGHTESSLARMICLLAREGQIKRKYYRYKWVSKLTWGKLRKKYFAKRQVQKELINEIRLFKKTH